MDPFLLTHRVTETLFDIGPGITPVSLRDQMIRGYLLATKAVKANVINSHKPLLVIGAGLAGAVTSITAANLEVPTTILDQEDVPLNLQLGCYSRVVSPSQYDWPSTHWANTGLPWTDGKIPLTWREGPADALAIELGRRFTLRAENGLFLKFRENTTIPNGELTQLKDWDVKRRGNFKINFADARSGKVDPSGPYHFSAVVSCVGQPQEGSRLGSYTGFRFWEPDPYSEQEYMPVPPRVYISGGGDGALQDFLRVATRRETAKEIYLSLAPSVREFVEQAIHTKEDNHQRTNIWFTKENDCEVHQSIQTVYEEVVNEVVRRHWRKIERGIRPMVGHLTHDSVIQLSFSCNHFKNYYGLNRFLTLLIARYFKEKEPSRTLLNPNSRTTRVIGINRHVCENSASKCHGKHHEVRWQYATCNTILDQYKEEGPYNVIILRHGPEKIERSFFDVPVLNQRQLLPYYL